MADVPDYKLALSGTDQRYLIAVVRPALVSYLFSKKLLTVFAWRSIDHHVRKVTAS